MRGAPRCGLRFFHLSPERNVAAIQRDGLRGHRNTKRFPAGRLPAPVVWFFIWPEPPEGLHAGWVLQSENDQGEPLALFEADLAGILKVALGANTVAVPASRIAPERLRLLTIYRPPSPSPPPPPTWPAA